MRVNYRIVFRAVVLALFFAYVVARGAQRGNDFKYPYLASQAYWKTSRLHVQAQPRYPISFHILLSPLASLPIGLAATVWAAVSFAAVAALPRVIEQLTGLGPRGQLLSWVVVLPCVVDALVLGQSDPINLFLVASALLAVRGGSSVRGVWLVGLAGMIKILPLVHWATVVSRTRSRGVWVGMLLTIGFALGLVVAAVGWESAWSGALQQWSWVANHEKPWHLVARGSDLRANNESLPIVLARTLGDLGPATPRHSLRLGLLPLEVVWMTWGAILGILALTWLACAWASRTVAPERAWLGMFSLSSVVMLASTPICWHHYFLWLLPATLYLADRRRLLWGAAAVSAVGTAFPAARGVGLHALLSLGLFAVIALDLLRQARRTRPDVDGPRWRPGERFRLAIHPVWSRVHQGA